MTRALDTLIGALGQIAAILLAAALAAGCRADCTSAEDCDRGQRCGERGFCVRLPDAAPIGSITPGASMEVVAVSPAPDAVAAPASGPVLVLTTRPVDPASVGAATFSVRDALGRDLPGSLEVLADPAGWLFAPAAPLARGAVYSARVTTGVRDAAGNPLRTPVSWTFTVADR